MLLERGMQLILFAFPSHLLRNNLRRGFEESAKMVFVCEEVDNKKSLTFIRLSLWWYRRESNQ